MLTSRKHGPIFIVGTGRSGSFALANFFRSFPEVVSHHELEFNTLLRLGYLYQTGYLSLEQVVRELRISYMSHIDAGIRFIDCSNALSRLLLPLSILYPDATFINITRHPRRVVSSFFYKFVDLMYPVYGVTKIYEWEQNGRRPNLMPELDKRIWRFVHAEVLSTDLDEILINFDEFRFRMICDYVKNCQLEIDEAIEAHPQINYFEKQFETLLDVRILSEFVGNLDLELKNGMETVLNKPTNVAFPKNYFLTENQQEVFHKVCFSTMERLNYTYDNESFAQY